MRLESTEKAVLFGQHVRVSEGQVREFSRSIQRGLEHVSPVARRKLRLWGRSNDGLQVSFGRAWQPFLGHTIGYNNFSKPPRIPIEEPCQVIGRAELWLRRLERDEPGGRVFLSTDGVVCDHLQIGTWEWCGEPPFHIVMRLLYATSLEQDRGAV